MRTFCQGGLTNKQIYALYANIVTCKNREAKFLAEIHGVTLGEDVKTNNKKAIESDKVSQLPLFGDPEEYKDLSEKEKTDLTNQMMKKHQLWATKGVKGIKCQTK